MRRRRRTQLVSGLLMSGLCLASIVAAGPQSGTTVAGDATASAGAAVSSAACLWYDRSRPEWPSDLVSVGDPARVTGVMHLQLLGSTPNPSRGRTTIRFAAPAASEPAVVVLHDLQGRILRVLRQPLIVAGPHDVVWDGYDAAGRPVAPGICFYRVRAAGETASGRMLVLR